MAMGREAARSYVIHSFVTSLLVIFSGMGDGVGVGDNVGVGVGVSVAVGAGVAVSVGVAVTV